MKTLLALLLLAVPVLGQSGTISMSSAPTSSAYVITLPPATGGQTHVQVGASGTFTQDTTVWNVLGAPVSATTIFCNEMRLDAGAVSLPIPQDLVPLATSMPRRARVEIVCPPFSTCSSQVVSIYSAGFTVTRNMLPGDTFTLSNTVRAATFGKFPFGKSSPVGRTSFAANDVFWNYQQQ